MLQTLLPALPPERPDPLSKAAAPWLKLDPCWQITMADFPPYSSARSSNLLDRVEEGIRCGSASKSPCPRTSTSTGHLGVPISRTSLSIEIVFGAAMVRPFSYRSGTRCFGFAPRGEIAVPHGSIEDRPISDVKNRGARISALGHEQTWRHVHVSPLFPSKRTFVIAFLLC